MKLEWQHQRNQREGVPVRSRALAALPRLAPRLRHLGPLLNLAGATPLKGLAGLSTRRPLPRWHSRPWDDAEITTPATGTTPDAALFVDTFTRWFEPGNARAAVRLLRHGNRTLHAVTAPRGERPLCCGRTWLSAGMLEEARREAERLVQALAPLARAGVPITGLEPSCLYTLRDEIPLLVPGDDAQAVARHAVLLEEHLDAEHTRGRTLPFDRVEGRVLVHGHCHQKAFGGADATLNALRRIPGLEVEPIESGCCGMAGAFGYHAEHYDTSMAMAELSLLPAVRGADAATRIVADGTSCQAQISDGAGRHAVHAAVVLAEALQE